MTPESECSMPAARLSSVLLPQPLGPTKTTNSPGSQIRVTPRTAGAASSAKLLCTSDMTSRPRAAGGRSLDDGFDATRLTAAPALEGGGRSLRYIGVSAKVDGLGGCGGFNEAIPRNDCTFKA